MSKMQMRSWISRALIFFKVSNKTDFCSWDVLRLYYERQCRWIFLFFVLFSNCVSGISTTGSLGMGSTTTSTTLRTTTWNIGRSTTASLPGRRNRSTSTPSPAVEVLDDVTTHLPSAASQIPAMEESCEAVEAREIMWFKTRQGQVAKQPCPAGTIGKPAPASLAQGFLGFACFLAH